MNLKLFKPDYISDKKKGKIDYSFFEEYLNKLKAKRLFKGGCGNIITPNYTLKKYDSLNMIEQQYEMNTIIKRYKETMGVKVKAKELFINSVKSNQNANGTCYAGTRTNFLMTQQIKERNTKQKPTKNPNKSSRDKPFNTLNNERCLSHNNIFSPRKTIKSNDQVAMTQGRMFNMKYNSSTSTKNSNVKKRKDALEYFIQYDKYTNVYDRNFLFEKLKKKFDFFKKEETFFERNKWKMFRFNENSPSYHKPEKQSFHRIKIMFMRDKTKLSML